MADKRPGQKIKMTSIDELLCVPDSSGTTEISVRDIYPFENHPFKVLDDEKMEELIESIMSCLFCKVKAASEAEYPIAAYRGQYRG